MIGLIAAKGLAAAYIEVYFTVFVVIVSLAVIAPAIAATVFVPLSARWPALRRSARRAAATGALLCIVTALVIWAIAILIANVLVGLDKLSAAMPYAAALTLGAAAWFQLRRRATFDASRGAAILGALLVPVFFFIAMMV